MILLNIMLFDFDFFKVDNEHKSGSESEVCYIGSFQCYMSSYVSLRELRSYYW